MASLGDGALRTERVATDPASAPGIERDVVAVVLAVLLVQLVFPYRHDWPAHLLGGAAAMFVVAAVAPRAAARLTALVGWVGLVGLAWITEHLLFGPPDLVDISFTLLGGVVAFEGADRIARTRGVARRRALLTGATALVLALAYRYVPAFGAG